MRTGIAGLKTCLQIARELISCEPHKKIGLCRVSRIKTKITLVTLITLLLIVAAAGLTYFINRRDAGAVLGGLHLLSAKKAPVTAVGWPANISTLAGGGASGLLDGAATQARFSDPFGLVFDPSGNLIVADGGENNRLRKISPDGQVSTLAGGAEGYLDGSSATARFNTPSGLALDQDGNIYVADTGNNVIRKVTPQGMVSTLAGNGQAGYRDGKASAAQFNGPLGVAVDQTGKVYVADTYNDRIRVISPDGQVTTLAGGAGPGYQDGNASDALFDTPCALVVNAKAEVFVADTRNNAIRKISSGAVSTVARSLPEEHDALLRRPAGLALTHDGFLYVGESSNGRILQITPGGELHGLSGIGIDIVSGDETSLRLQRPVGIALDSDGALLVADAATYAIRKVGAKRNDAPIVHSVTSVADPLATAAAKNKTASFPWPLKPQNQAHEVVGTIGEVRGNYDGESRDHFHGGVDMQAAMGAPVLAVTSEKVSNPLPAWAVNGLSEGFRIASMSYIHMRVGRTLKDAPLDPGKFTLIKDAQDNLLQVRIKRGTRFQLGETLGTVNRMFHVHLNYNPAGQVINPLSLSFTGFKDELAPQINGIQIVDRTGQTLSKKKHDRQLVIARSLGAVSIVVDAYDQADGNAKRRRLGLYQAGYQILHADGRPLPGYETPRINIEFNRLPADDEAVKIAYFANSGITVHGSATTRFLYNVTSVVRDGHAHSGFWQVQGLAPGDYLIRIFAADYAGNQAKDGRDLAIRLE